MNRPLTLEIAEAAEEYDAEHLTGASSDSLRTQRALRYQFLAPLVSAHRLGFKIQLCGWKIEDMTLQAPTENVEEPASFTKRSGIEFF